MSLLDEEASDGDKSRCIDLEPPSDDAIIWETTASGGFSSEQKHPQPVNVDGVIGARAAPPSRKTNKPLADQTVAFQNALLQAPGALLSIRGGRARHLAKDYYAGQENDPKAVMGGDGGSFHAQPGAASRKTKIPLADQAVAFQDALQRSTGASPSSIGGGVLLQNTEREEAAAAARKYAKLRRKNAAKMRKKREQQQGQMG